MTRIAQKKIGFNSDEELAKYMLDNLADSLKQAIKTSVKAMMKTELETLRQDMEKQVSFNGYYGRNMTTPLGKIEDIPLARFREIPVSGLDLKTHSVFDQQKEKFYELITEMHRNGLSQRKVGKLALEVLGIKTSKNKIGTLHKELAEQESFQINSQALDDEFEYLLCDGVWVKAKQFGLKSTNKTVLLCALGIRKDGSRKIIAFAVAESESYESWATLLEGLKQRGLKGKNLQLIISDDNEGCHKATKHFYPTVPIQICIVHKIRNVFSIASHKHKRGIAQDSSFVYKADTQEEAMERFKKFCKKWYVKEERSVNSFRHHFEPTLTYFQFPQEHWKQIRTNNILEREIREIRRRTKVFDNSFQSNDSLYRYGNSIFNNLNNHYPAHAFTH